MKKLFAAAILLAAFLAACQKEVSFIAPPAPTPEPTGNAAINAFFEKQKTAPQRFTIIANSADVFTGAKGTTLSFPANAFVKKNGAAVTGTVNIELVEIYSAADMILNNMPTLSNGKPLESGGEFLIKATQAGEELLLAKDKQVIITLNNSLSEARMQNMQVFNGQPDSAIGVNWVVNTDPANVVESRSDSAGMVGFKLFSDSLQWINCDRFINETLIKYNVDISAVPADSNVAVYVHLTGRNSIIPVYERDGLVFKSSSLIATAATIVSISVKDDKVYAAFAPVTLTNNGTTKLVYNAFTEEQLKAKLQTLQ